MARYPVLSNSTARKFIDPIRRQRSFGGLFRTGEMKRLAETDHPVPMNEIGDALAVVGDRLIGRLGKDSVRTCSAVEQITVPRVSPGRFTLRLSSGERLSAASVVLASGRRDVRHPQLKAWPDKIVFAGDVMSQAGWFRRAVEAGSRRFALVGASHSAFSVLWTMYEEDRKSVV